MSISFYKIGSILVLLCKRYATPFILVASLLLTSACSTTTVRRKADHLNTIDNSNYRILILPPAAEVYMIGMSGKKRMYDYEYQLEGILTDEISSKIENMGFKSVKVIRRELFDRSLLREFEGLYTRYSDIRTKLYKTIGLEEKKAFSMVENIGPDATKIASTWGTDFLVFINYVRNYKDNSSRAVGLVMNLVLGSNGSEAADSSLLTIAIVEAKTGDILWTNLQDDSLGLYSSVFANMSDENKMIIKRIGNILKPLFQPLEKDLKSIRK